MLDTAGEDGGGEKGGWGRTCARAARAATVCCAWATSLKERCLVTRDDLRAAAVTVRRRRSRIARRRGSNSAPAIPDTPKTVYDGFCVEKSFWRRRTVKVMRGLVSRFRGPFGLRRILAGRPAASRVSLLRTYIFEREVSPRPGDQTPTGTRQIDIKLQKMEFSGAGAIIRKRLVGGRQASRSTSLNLSRPHSPRSL